MQQQDMELAQREGDMNFSLYYWDDEPLVEGVTQFQYLGRTLKHTENYCPSVNRKIGKAWAV